MRGGEFLQERVRPLVPRARGGVALRVGGRAARKDGMEDDLRAGLFFAYPRDDLLNGLGDVGGVGIVRGVVVRADHEDDVLRREPVQFAVLDAPEDVLRAVAGVTEVEDGPSVRQRRPFREMPPLPVVHDGIAHENHVHRPSVEARDLLAVVQEAVRPPVVAKDAWIAVPDLALRAQFHPGNGRRFDRSRNGTQCHHAASSGHNNRPPPNLSCSHFIILSFIPFRTIISPTHLTPGGRAGARPSR